MARKLEINTTVSKSTENEITAALAGIGGGFDPSRYVIKSGLERAGEERAVNFMMFGAWGSGKTFTVVDLLRLGFHVIVLKTDYGKRGTESVYAYFVDHPEDRHLLKRLQEVAVDYDGLNEFSRRPASLFPDIYDHERLVIFWDGASAYQEVEAEGEAVGRHSEDDFRETNWALWRKTRNATVFPLDRILSLSNTKYPDRPWYKFVTLLEKETGTYEERVGKGGEPFRVLKPGTEEIGPLLHTSARDIAPAGISLIIHTIKRLDIEDGRPPHFDYEIEVRGTKSKQCGFNLPSRIEDARFYDVWKKYIEPKVMPFEVPGGNAGGNS